MSFSVRRGFSRTGSFGSNQPGIRLVVTDHEAMPSRGNGIARERHRELLDTSWGPSVDGAVGDWARRGRFAVASNGAVKSVSVSTPPHPTTPGKPRRL